jgi:hypothetical protein
MESIFGPKLELGQPTGAEREWIFEAMQKPQIYVPLSCPQPPTRTLFEQNRLFTREKEGDYELDVRWLIARNRSDGLPRAFFIDFGWSGALDVIRDVDLAIPGESAGISLYMEANLLVVIYLFRHRLAKRLRWRVSAAGAPRGRWWEKVGVRCVESFEEPHPQTGEPLKKLVYELTPAEYARILKRGDVDLDQSEREFRLSLRKIVRAPRGD